MGSENHIETLIIILCYILPSELADGRKLVATRHSLELVKHKGTIKSIESDDGVVIDCVDIYKQPAFDDPLLKNHTIEMQPSSIKNRVREENNQTTFVQGWHKYGECPEGTIPIIRTPKSVYRRKFPSTDPAARPGHEYVQVTLTGGKYYGVQATLNVWAPKTYGTEFSIAQLWVLSGHANNFNTLEAGWIVRSGDTNAKIFIYWTRDNYQTTGCYNLECPGFVQVNRRVAFGIPLKPSTYNGQQFHIQIFIHKNKESGHWWLQVHDEVVGYWPASILTTLAESSDAISWGGEILNDELGGHHTSTQMGSGHFSGEGSGKACYFRNLKYMDATGAYRDPEKLIPYVSKPSCYDLNLIQDNTQFYFGGPGYSNKCPR